MIHVLAFVLPSALCLSENPVRSPVVARELPAMAADSLEAVFEAGQPWAEFYAAVNRRRELWERNWIRVRGCWVEQPKSLQDFWLPIVARKETSAHFENEDGVVREGRGP